MRRRRHRTSVLAGDGISFEEVLTIITVLLLLRVVFMVPMVNLDKAKTVTAQRDHYWALEAAHVLSSPSDPAALRPYSAAFDLGDLHGDVKRSGKITYLEAAAADSAIVVIRHVPDRQSFVALRVEGDGQSRSFRRGKILWSQAEGEWFVAADTIDYGSDSSSRAMEREFRQMTRKERGY